MSEREKLEKQRLDALDLAEAIYNTPTSPNYRDNIRFKWAVKTINEEIDKEIAALTPNPK